MLKGGGDSVGFVSLVFEFFAEVGVFVGEDPAFDAGYGGELQDGEGAGGVGRLAGERRCMAAWIAFRSSSRSVLMDPPGDRGRR